ncbi:MAG: universal stress protein, partial [Solirubrobacterales bacterium]|nr:universal stress protein [Solirubrobacterales bacterium]
SVADYLVVGTGRKGTLRRTLLGSVSEFCVRHARCPVVVVPDPAFDAVLESAS